MNKQLFLKKINLMNFKIGTLLLSLALFTGVFSIENPVLNQSGHVGLKESFSALTLGSTNLYSFIQIDFSSDKDQIGKVIEINKNSNVPDTTLPTLTLITFRPFVVFGATNFLDVGASIPLYFDIMDQFSPEGGFGNLELNTKVRIPLKESIPFQTALFTSFNFPTANLDAGYAARYPWYLKKSESKDSSFTHKILGCYGNGKPELSLIALFSLCFKKISFHVNSGVRLTFNSDVDELYILNSGIELKPLSNMTLFFDAGSMTRFSNVKNDFRIDQDHLRLAPGISFRSSGGALFTISGDFKISSNQQKIYYDINSNTRRISSRNEPTLMLSIQTGWGGTLGKKDRDNDQVPDKDDKCPDIAEDIDRFEDADGCPDTDNDKDGISDGDDKCRDMAEDFDGVDDHDGCPDYDNDKDGILDSLDKCGGIPEDIDGYEDFDGCPDYDNDKDGVPDSLDICLMIPEDIDAFQDEDGCPDIDNDLDGVPDSLDLCRDQAGKLENNGCEITKIEPKEIKFGRVILKGVDFGSGSTILSEGAYIVLDQLVASLSASQEIILDIQAHTDNSGDEQENIRLCQKRAEIICDYLVKKGIKRNRLNPIGKGGAEPVADNETVKGRILNTRIEIKRNN